MLLLRLRFFQAFSLGASSAYTERVREELGWNDAFTHVMLELEVVAVVVFVCNVSSVYFLIV